MQEFDLIVIGSGSGLDVANAVAEHGWKVAIIERSKMGGTCLNRGCIPSKLLIHSADVAEVIKRADLFGIKINKLSVDFESIVNRSNKIIDSESSEIKDAFYRIDNPKLFLNECRFIGEKTLAVSNGQTIRAENILIASGSRPKIPMIDGLDGTDYLTSDEALRLKKQPRIITIIGGGYIAAELAHFYGALGTKINIIQRRDILLPTEDDDIAHKFTELFLNKYNVFLGYNVRHVKSDAKAFYVMAKNCITGKTINLESDQLLVASGRVPNSKNLDLDRTGVKTDENGFIVVDDYLQTNIKGIFALGDIVGRYMFKHSANHEAQYAFNNIVHPDRKIAVDYTAMPHAIFSWPQVAGVGYTEQELRKQNVAYDKVIYPYIQTAMGEALEDKDGFVKFLASKNDGKILGCHIIGSHASILIHEVLVAMKAGPGTTSSIARTIHIHPALSEVVSRAASSFA